MWCNGNINNIYISQRFVDNPEDLRLSSSNTAIGLLFKCKHAARTINTHAHWPSCSKWISIDGRDCASKHLTIDVVCRVILALHRSMTAEDPIESARPACISRAPWRGQSRMRRPAWYPRAGGPAREKIKEKLSGESLLVFVATREAGNVYRLFLLERPTLRAIQAGVREAGGGGGGWKRGTTPQPLLLNQGCWLSLRDGMARYKIPGITPLLTVRAMLTFKIYLDEIAGEGGGERGRYSTWHPPR